MRVVGSGCRGCLSTALGILIVVGVIAATAWLAVGVLQAPHVERVRFSAEDGVRAQRKLLDLAHQRPRTSSAVITEAELNAFVARHLDPADLPLGEPVIHLQADDRVELAGMVTLGRLLHDSPLASVADVLPAAWAMRPVWLTVVADARLMRDSRPILRLVPRRLTIGRRRVPTFVLRLVLDPASFRLMRIVLPPDVETVRVERGRVVIERTSQPPRT